MSVRWLAVSPLILLAACNPTASEVESVLMTRGFDKAEASCVAHELEGRLTESDWRMIAEVAGDTMRTDEEWKDMTIGEIGDKLSRLSDTRVAGTLLRAGIGCMILTDGSGDRARSL